MTLSKEESKSQLGLSIFVPSWDLSMFCFPLNLQRYALTIFDHRHKCEHAEVSLSSPFDGCVHLIARIHSSYIKPDQDKAHAINRWKVQYKPKRIIHHLLLPHAAHVKLLREFCRSNRLGLRHTLEMITPTPNALGISCPDRNSCFTNDPPHLCLFLHKKLKGI